MKKTLRSLMLVAVAGSTLWGMNCTTSLRDAAIGGALDYVTGTTAELLSAYVPADLLLPADE